MIILQGAIHIFTEQPNSVAKSIYNGLRRQMTHLLEYETIKTSTIIQYPHAVSYFCELNLSYALPEMEKKKSREREYIEWSNVNVSTVNGDINYDEYFRLAD